MKKYGNKNGLSGVTGYDTTPDSICVEFNNKAIYRYTSKSAGKKIITKMKVLAANGRGLSTYISQIVKSKFDKKLR